MLHKDKNYIVGDSAFMNKQRGTIKYIGEIISSNKVCIGLQLDATKRNMRKELLQNSKKQSVESTHCNIKSIKQFEDNTSTNGKFNKIKYIPQGQNIIFVQASLITKYIKGINNKQLSRKYRINDIVWISNIKSMGTIKAMFDKPPKYIKQQLPQPGRDAYGDKISFGRQYLGILLKEKVGNNLKNETKYFDCKDGFDYFIKADSKYVMFPNERIVRLSAKHIEMIIHFWMNGRHIAQELANLIISYFGAKDDKLIIKEMESYKLPEECHDVNDFYEYDSIHLGARSRLYGGKLICLKCFGDLVMDIEAEITVSAIVNFDAKEVKKMNKMNGSKLLKYGARGVGTEQRYRNYRDSGGLGKGGGIIKIICFGNVILKSAAKIVACGQSATNNGEGGSVFIKCKKLSNQGYIYAWGRNEWGQSRIRNTNKWILRPTYAAIEQFNGGRVILDVEEYDEKTANGQGIRPLPYNVMNMATSMMPNNE